MKKRKPRTLDEYYAPLYAAILGLLGPKVQKETMDKIGEHARKMHEMPNLILQALRNKK